MKYSKKKMIFDFVRGSKRYFVLGTIAALLSIELDMVLPQIVKFTIDSVLDTKPYDIPSYIVNIIEKIGGRDFLRANLLIIAVAAATVALVNALFKYLNRLYNAKASEIMSQTMRAMLYSHIERLPYTWHMNVQTGDIIQRCTSDVNTVKMFLSDYLVAIVRMVLLLIITLFHMYPMNRKLTTVAFCSIPVILGYSIFFRTKIEYLFKQCDENEGVLSTIAQENLTSVRVVRAFGRERDEKEKFEKQNNIYTDDWLKLCKYLSAFWGIGDLVSGLQVMIIVSFGCVLCVKGEISTGEFIAFISYNSMLIWPIRQLSRVVTEMSKAGVSLERIYWIMSAREEKTYTENKATVSGDIRYENVSFSYDSGSEVLSEVSFEIKQGTVFGVLGGTGSGKSTLMLLLNRLYDLGEGQGSIYIGDRNIKDIGLAELRSNIGMVLQEPYLFSKTIGENIAISKENPTIENIRSAAETACLDETVMSFTKGYDTVVGERGVTLSGGQKQRAAIARVIIDKKPILVFDDSLSAVDTETDAKIQAALKEKFGDSTVIIISHRITSLMQADKILVLEKGRVSDIGTHEELVSRDGMYKKVFEMQTAGMEAI